MLVLLRLHEAGSVLLLPYNAKDPRAERFAPDDPVQQPVQENALEIWNGQTGSFFVSKITARQEHG